MGALAAWYEHRQRQHVIVCLHLISHCHCSFASFPLMGVHGEQLRPEAFPPNMMIDAELADAVGEHLCGRGYTCLLEMWLWLLDKS